MWLISTTLRLLLVLISLYNFQVCDSPQNSAIMEPENDTVEVIEIFEKSQNDKKQYRSIRLANGMKVILIHDDRVDEDDYHNYWPSCALTVSVGSFSDPNDLPGLAKYVARMMYHSDNDFIHFITYDGPESNSDNYTPRNRYRARLNSLDEIVDDKHTTFSFISRTNKLNEALSRYAKLLKMPLNMRNSMAEQREEFKEKFDLHSYDYAKDKLLSLLGTSGHPSRNFAWGNMKALSDKMDDDTLYQRIEGFKRRHYSANRMSLALQTNLSLDEMQEMVSKHFSSVPNNKLSGIDFTQFTHENAFTSEFHENVYFVKPYYETSEVQLTWCIPPVNSTDEIHPQQFLSYIMHANCDGCLHEYLRKRNWVYTDYRFDRKPVLKANGIFSFFTIEAKFTDDGMKHLDDVLEVIFSYVRLNLQQLRESKVAEPLYRDFVNVKNAQRFQEMLPQDSTAHFAQALMNFPFKDQLSYEYDADAIQKAIDTLNKRNFNIIVTSRTKYDKSIEFSSKDENCRIEYTDGKMPDKWISLWNDPKSFPDLSLPTPNPYIATNFTILYDGSQTIPKYPTKVYESDVSELWFRQDEKYLLPTAHCALYLKASTAYSPVENKVFVSMLRGILQARAYKHYFREQAGIFVSYSRYDDGLGIELRGPSQNFHLVIDDLTKELINLSENITKEEFDKALILELEPAGLAEYGTDVYYTPDILQSIILTEHVTYHEQYRLAKQIQFVDLQNFRRQFFKQARILALIQGNLNEEAAISIIRTTEINFGSEKNYKQVAAKPHARKLPPGTNYLLLNALHHSQYQTATKYYYQIGPTSKRTKLIIELLIYINRNPRFHDRMKTFHENCYFYWDVYDDCGILGYTVSAMSTEQKTSMDAVDKLIEEVRNEMIALVENMTPEEFQEHLSILRKFKFSHKEGIINEMARNMAEIRNGEYLFDRHTQMLETISSINQSEVIQFYREHRAAEGRVLLIKVIGYTKETGLRETKIYSPPPAEQLPDDFIYANSRKLSSGNQITNIDEFKKSLDVYA